MKKLLLLTLTVLCIASLAFAQNGSFLITADPGGANCNLPDNVVGLCSYYVVHVLSPGATAAEFGAPIPGCLLAAFLSEGTTLPVKLGDATAGGTSIGYGVCMASPVLVLTINFFCQALTPPCCYYPLTPHNVNGGPFATDCSGPPPAKLTATAGTGIVNSVAPECVCDVATKESTWGAMKSLYRE